jgi:hypothetical protein
VEVLLYSQYVLLRRTFYIRIGLHLATLHCSCIHCRSFYAQWRLLFFTFTYRQKIKSARINVAGIAMYLSALCMGLIVLVPYRGNGVQIALHNAAALLFVLFAAIGLAWLARKLHDNRLGFSAALQVGISRYMYS